MRPLSLLPLLALPLLAQFKSSVPLVLAPTTITDSHGHYIDGLTASDLILYDNNVPQLAQLDFTSNPISLVVAVQAGANSGPVLDKLGATGILFSQLLAAGSGETALLSFSDDIRIHHDFSADSDILTHSLRMLSREGDNARSLDALMQALQLLETRDPSRRRIILMLAEKRDRGSKTPLSEVIARLERLNATVYWLTFSPFLEPFTAKPKTMEDLKPEAARIKPGQCALCPQPDDRPAPYDPGPGSPIYALGELFRLRQADLSTLLTNITGGRTAGFVKKNALEQAIQLVSAEVHRQYVLSFQPKPSTPGEFHTLRVAVKDRPDLRVKTRAGYWTLE
jgi:VWFA-related protein